MYERAVRTCAHIFFSNKYIVQHSLSSYRLTEPIASSLQRVNKLVNVFGLTAETGSGWLRNVCHFRNVTHRCFASNVNILIVITTAVFFWGGHFRFCWWYLISSTFLSDDFIAFTTIHLLASPAGWFTMARKVKVWRKNVCSFSLSDWWRLQNICQITASYLIEFVVILFDSCSLFSWNSMQ